MTRLKFKPMIHTDGSESTMHWRSSIIKREGYSIGRYEFYRGAWVKPYFRAYVWSNGKGIEDKMYKTFLQAVRACERHNDEHGIQP